MTLYGLYTVFIKVNKIKSSFYLFRRNFSACLIVLLISSFVNWDTLIAGYNFKHANESFLHLDFMSTLSDKTLPYLDKSTEELRLINKNQQQKFPFEQKYMSIHEYRHIINTRKSEFIEESESKSFLSWSYPEYKAYRKLKD
jgi:hypothetical protein